MPGHAYERFGKYYDYVYRDLVDYDGDCDFLEALFQKFLRTKPTSILDLGCGTGNHVIALAKRGYDVVGVDASKAQLREARRKVRGKDVPVRFVHGDMRRFDLRRPFDAAICMFGGFGYVLRNRDVLSHFAHVRRHIAPAGVYAFEFWQESGAVPGHMGWIHKETPFRIIRLDRSTLNSKRHRITHDFGFFIFDGDRLKERFSESHTLRLYAVPELRQLLARAGLRLAAAYGVTRERKGFQSARKEFYRVMAVAKPSGRR